MKITVTSEELLAAFERMRRSLSAIANQVSSDEGDEEATEDEFGLPVTEVIEMAHDNMISEARGALEDKTVQLIFDKQRNLFRTTVTPKPANGTHP